CGRSVGDPGFRILPTGLAVVQKLRFFADMNDSAPGCTTVTLDRIIHASADELKGPREMEESVRNDLKRIYGDEIQEFFSKYLGRVETIGHLIDQRFEELKAQILEEEV
ncbi:MAG: hypothetical protein WBW48_16520, partial [Anaerolineae bacterium]